MIKEAFDKFGFVVVRNAFTEGECQSFKRTVLDYFTDSNGDLKRNLNKNYRDGNEAVKSMAFNDPHLSILHDIFKNKKVNEHYSLLTQNKTIFLHHSDAHVDTVAGKGWHNDAINNSDGRKGQKWKDKYIKTDYWAEVDNEKYCVIRCALYLQEHRTNTDGLYIMAGSHKAGTPKKEVYLKTSLGDLILFDARTFHRGGNNVAKGNKRAAIFWAVGRDNIFSQEHKVAAIARQKYQQGIKDYTPSKGLSRVLTENNIGL